MDPQELMMRIVHAYEVDRENYDKTIMVSYRNEMSKLKKSGKYHILIDEFYGKVRMMPGFDLGFNKFFSDKKEARLGARMAMEILALNPPTMNSSLYIPSVIFLVGKLTKIYAKYEGQAQPIFIIESYNECVKRNAFNAFQFEKHFDEAMKIEIKKNKTWEIWNQYKGKEENWSSLLEWPPEEVMDDVLKMIE